MAILITGMAGFIGSNLAEYFLKKNGYVFGIDNLSRGTDENLSRVSGNSKFRIAHADLNDIPLCRNILKEFNSVEPITEIWHMAANSDIPAGVKDPTIDLNDTFLSTFNVLQLMKEFNIKVISFASSSAIYGDLGDTKLIESSGPLFPISNYGAMKLASEAAVSAAVESFLEKAFIFRFPNVVGTPATHGVILDFINKLKVSRNNLSVLGNGSQQKSYLHVDELINAMIFIRENAVDRINAFNIGPNDTGVKVSFIAEQVVSAFSKNAGITYGKETRGWVGDVPKFKYSINKLSSLGWNAELTSSQAVMLAVSEIIEQEENK